MISAVFRRGGDVSFVAEELKAVFDPQGGQWMGGRYVPSLLAAIGEVIEQHLIETGFRDSSSDPLSLAPHEQAGVMIEKLQSGAGGDGSTHIASSNVGAANAGSADFGPANKGAAGIGSADMGAANVGVERPKRFCPRCSSPHLVHVEGCWVCRDCGFSKCG